MEQLDNLKTKGEKITNEVREKALVYVMGGLGVVVALAWNEAIKALIDFIFPVASANTITAKFFYAIVLTAVIVVVTMHLSVAPREEK